MHNNQQIQITQKTSPEIISVDIFAIIPCLVLLQSPELTYIVYRLNGVVFNAIRLIKRNKKHA